MPISRTPTGAILAAVLVVVLSAVSVGAAAGLPDDGGLLGDDSTDDGTTTDGSTDGSTNDSTTSDLVDDTTDTTTDVVNDTADTTGDTLNDTTNTTTDTVDETTDTVNETTDTTTETVNETTETVDGATDGDATGTVNDTTETVDDTTGDATGTVDGTVDNTTDTVDDTTDSATNATSDTVDSATDAADSTVGGVEDATGTEGTLSDTTEDLTGTVDETADGMESTVDSAERNATGTVDDTVGGADSTLDGADGTLGGSDGGDAGAGDAGSSAAGDGGAAGAAGDGASARAPTDGSQATASSLDDGGALPSIPAAPGDLPEPTPENGAAVGLLAVAAAALGRHSNEIVSAAGAVVPIGTRSAVATARTGLWNRIVRFFAPFRYSRYDDSDPLENDARADVYDAVTDEPGVYLSAVGERTDLSLSSVRHHVRVLEREDLVMAAKVRGKRRYYPAYAENVELAAALDEDATAAIIDALSRLGPSSVSALADELDRDPSTVTHHCKRLEEDDIVVRERDGRAVLNRLSDETERALTDPEPTAGAADRAPASAD